MGFLIGLLWPFLAGGGMYLMSNQCKGKNAKLFFRYGAWGFWLLYMWFIPGILFLPFGPVLAFIIKLAPSVICFYLAANAIIKEMRAQAQGQYTDAA